MNRFISGAWALVLVDQSSLIGDTIADFRQPGPYKRRDPSEYELQTGLILQWIANV